jgi:nitrous oxidase accessory protein
MRALPGLILIAAACGGTRTDAPGAAVAPPRPAGASEVAPGESLQARIDAAPDGAALALLPGEHRGPLVIRRPLTLWGPATAVLRASDGSTVSALGAHVTLLGFTVDGSGQRFDLMDGGVRLEGEDHRVEGVTVRNALFGILVQNCRRAHVIGNQVIGTGQPAMGLRGDAIRLWETNDTEVRDNVVTDARDLVVWYSSRNHLSGNVVTRCRYGTHFMYSHENVVEASRYVGNEVGVFVMYSRDIAIRRNLLARSGGAAGIGIGLKEAGNVTVSDNWLLANTTGIYIDASPLDPAHFNRYVGNAIRLAETAVAMHSSLKNTEFHGNDFRDNGAVVTVGAQGDALAVSFAGNYYDTYRGYDLDGDGRGDVPFEFRRLSTQLESRYPELALLHGAPAMDMVDLVGQVLPLFAPRPLLTDAAPRVGAPRLAWTPETDHAR